jgi:hypothetical protein
MAAAVATTKTIAMTTFQKSIVAAALIVTAGAGVFEAKQAADARGETARLRAEQAPLAEQIRQLQRERDQASNQLAAVGADTAKDKSNELELLRLRGLAGVARRNTEELERMRMQLLAKQAGGGQTNLLTSAMADAVGQAMAQQVQDKLARLTESLHLTPAQTLSISNILMRQAGVQSAAMQQAFTGQFNKTEIMKQAMANGNPETQIKALLTPEQLAAYPQYQQADFAHTASMAANTDLMQLDTLPSLTSEQRDAAYAALYGVNFDQVSGNSKPPASITNMADVMTWPLEQKIKALETVLTPAQLDMYREQQAAQAKLMKNVLNQWDKSGNGK